MCVCVCVCVYIYKLNQWSLKNMPTLFMQRSKIPNKCLEYDTKPSDGEASILELIGNVMYSFFSIATSSKMIWIGCMCLSFIERSN